MRRLRRVGFYRELSYGNAHDPSLRESLSTVPLSHAREIVEYLRGGRHLASAFLVSHDVLDPTRRLGPVSLLTDGTWAWPSDLAHYVATHHLQLPTEFLDHMQQHNWQPVLGNEPLDDIQIEGMVPLSDSVTDGDRDA